MISAISEGRFRSARRNPTYWLIGAFLAGFLAIGILYWPVPYNKVTLPNTLYGAGLGVVWLAAALARAFGKAHFLMVILVVAAAVPAAVMTRVCVEVIGDATSHNLWPLEVIIAMVVGLICASAGTLAGCLPRFFARHPKI